MHRIINFRKNKSAQTTVFVGYILPALDEQSYFQDKLSQMEKHYKSLKKLSYYVPFHTQSVQKIQIKISNLKKHWPSNDDYQFLQKQLGNLQQKYKLTVISQKISLAPETKPFSHQIVHQVIAGTFSNFNLYFKEILKPNNLVVLNQLRITNQEPVAKNPIIQAEIELRYFNVPL